jgi:hypothetical protein
VVTISISAEALSAIEATLPDGREADRRPDGKGGYFVTLPHNVLNKLNYLRGPGESYGDVIIRVARDGEGRYPCAYPDINAPKTREKLLVVSH